MLDYQTARDKKYLRAQVPLRHGQVAVKDSSQDSASVILKYWKPLAVVLVTPALCWLATRHMSAQAAGPDTFSRKESFEEVTAVPLKQNLDNSLSETSPIRQVLSDDSDSRVVAPSKSQPLHQPLQGADEVTHKTGAQSYPLPKLETVDIRQRTNGEVYLGSIPKFSTQFGGKVAGISKDQNNFVFYTIDPELQKFVEKAVKSAKDLNVAVVVMSPKTGKILAMADKSNEIEDLSLHAGFPAASLFKLVTATAAMETASVEPDTSVSFRGGTYTLNQWNYIPNAKKDRRRMTVEEALGKSCNPVFGRLAFNFLTPSVLKSYTNQFGFNSDLDFDIPLEKSLANIPTDKYEMSLTGAGFGDVSLSPIHAAAIASGIANHGRMPRPSLIDRIVNRSGTLMYQSKPSIISHLAEPGVTESLLRMMESTTTVGTSRKAFMKHGRPVLPGIQVAAKTGTLRGENPKGINNWFIAVAPADNPTVALSVIVVDPVRVNTKASEIGKQVLQKFLFK